MNEILKVIQMNPNSIYQISLHTDVYEIPHSFISFKIDGNTIATLGFAPANEHKLISPGAVFDDSKHHVSQTINYTVSSTEFINALEYVQEVYINPPEYALPFGAQCAIVSNNVLAKANVKGFHYVDMKPE